MAVLRVGVGMKKYKLQIYFPGSLETALLVLESDTPFMAISKGDFLNPRFWSSHANDLLNQETKHLRYGAVLRCVGVEHFIVEGMDGKEGTAVCHVFNVFTEALEDLAESRR